VGAVPASTACRSRGSRKCSMQEGVCGPTSTPTPAAPITRVAALSWRRVWVKHENCIRQGHSRSAGITSVAARDDERRRGSSRPRPEPRQSIAYGRRGCFGVRGSCASSGAPNRVKVGPDRASWGRRWWRTRRLRKRRARCEELDSAARPPVSTIGGRAAADPASALCTGGAEASPRPGRVIVTRSGVQRRRGHVHSSASAIGDRGDRRSSSAQRRTPTLRGSGAAADRRPARTSRGTWRTRTAFDLTQTNHSRAARDFVLVSDDSIREAGR